MANEALGANAVHDISASLNALLADMFGLYLKTKNFHWHVTGPHFRDYHLLLDVINRQVSVGGRMPEPHRSAAPSARGAARRRRRPAARWSRPNSAMSRAIPAPADEPAAVR